MNETERLNEYAAVLADGLDALLAGQLALDELLARHPQHADYLRPELEAALLLHTLGRDAAPHMPPHQVAALESRVLAAFDAPAAGAAPATTVAPVSARRVIAFPRSALGRAAASIALVMLLLFGGGGGLIAASAGALPGDALYPVKRGWEDVRLAFAGVTGQAGSVQREITEARLTEAETLAAHGHLTADALADLEASVQALLDDADASAQADLAPLLGRIHAALAAWESLGQAGDPATGDRLRDLTAPTVTPTPTPTITPTPTPTVTPTSTPTVTPSPGEAGQVGPLAPAGSATPTSRIPPTPTRTATATPSLTPTLTALIPPTATITPVPLVIPVVTADPPTAPPPTSGPPSPGVVVPTRPSPTWYPWMRATEDYLHGTRTAESAP